MPTSEKGNDSKTLCRSEATHLNLLDGLSVCKDSTKAEAAIWDSKDLRLLCNDICCVNEYSIV